MTALIWLHASSDKGRGDDVAMSMTREGSTCFRGKWVEGGVDSETQKRRGKMMGKTGHGQAPVQHGTK